MNNFIELSNLTKTFIAKKNVKVLKKVNFKFELGKIYSLMGPSGSGKSTLLNLISLIDRPSSGLIKYQNKQIDFNKNEVKDLFRAQNIENWGKEMKTRGKIGISFDFHEIGEKYHFGVLNSKIKLYLKITTFLVLKTGNLK